MIAREDIAEASAPGTAGPLAETNAIGTMSRWDVRRAKERLRIEKAALKLLLERGFYDVTADDIAEAAEISRRTFFRYFPSRDDVLTGVHMRSLLHLFELLRARPASESLIEALVNASRQDLLPSADQDEVEIAELSKQLMAKYEEAWERAVGQARNAIQECFTEVVSFRLKAAGQDPAGAPIIAASLWAVSCHVFLQWLRGGYKGSLPDYLLDALQTLRDSLAYEPGRAD